MILSVVIPQYKEDDHAVRRLLNTIDYQLNVNWDEVEVIIVNDHSDVILSDKMLNSFENIKPKYIKMEKNVGPGPARQAGLDAAQGEYVTFCDADDMYQNFGVFSLYLEEIRTKHPDIIQTQWIEEIRAEIPQQDGTTKQQLVYMTHDFEATWMHGKCFRKQYLTDNNIRFSDKLRYHEDSYILSCAFELTDKVVRDPVVSYVWTFDENSITRRNNGAYSYESMPEFIRAIRYSIDWLSDKTPQKIPSKVVQLILYIYYMMQTNKQWEQKYVDPIEEELYTTLTKYEKEFNSLDMATFSALDLQEHQKVAGRPFIMSETFSQWVNRIIAQRRPKDEAAVKAEPINITEKSEKVEEVKEEAEAQVEATTEEQVNSKAE